MSAKRHSEVPLSLEVPAEGDRKGIVAKVSGE